MVFHLFVSIDIGEDDSSSDNGGTSISAADASNIGDSQPPLDHSFLVPLERNPLFTGRDAFLVRLRTSLEDTSPNKYTHRVAIHGLGGIGKTQIALEYGYRYRSQYNHIFWLYANDRTSLLSGFASVVRETHCIRITGNSALEYIAAEMLKWLDQNDKWLLVLDNVDDISIVRGLLPATSAGGHTLITTRIRDVKQIPAEGLEVDLLEEAHAMELLLLVSDGNVRDAQAVNEARKIVQELGLLPLAIDQAAAFIRSADLYTFLDIVRSNTIQFLSENPKGNQSYLNSISATWQASLNRLSTIVSEFAEILAFLNPDEILLEILEAGGSGLSENLQNVLNNKFSLMKILTELQSLSLIKVSGRGSKCSIHRLVQSVIRESLPIERRINKEKEILDAFSVAFQYSLDGLNPTSRILYRKYLPQITSCLVNFDKEGYDSFAMSELSEKVAAFLFDEGQGFECQQLNKTLLSVRMRILGPDHRRTLRIKRGLAAVYCGFNLGRGNEGIKLFEETLQRQIEVCGPRDPDTLWTMHGLGATYNAWGRTKEAAKILQETYELRCQVLGEDDLHTLRTKFFLAGSYQSRGLSGTAVTMFEETLVVQYQVLGQSHFDTLRTMQCLARLYTHLGDVIKARTLLREVLLQRMRTLGKEHTSTIGVEYDLKRTEFSLLRIDTRNVSHFHSAVM